MTEKANDKNKGRIEEKISEKVSDYGFFIL